MKYSKKDLIKAVEMYYVLNINNPDNFEDTKQGCIVEDAEKTVELLVSIMKEFKN